jgi:GntR family transcriptional regulator
MQLVHLDYRDARPIYTQIADNFRNQIRAGILSQGDKLPSVRELASELAINPNTIQRAYRELESGGWIVTVAGKGCFVSDHTPANSQRQQLLEEFDRVCAALVASGVSREDLAQIILQGGNDHA